MFEIELKGITKIFCRNLMDQAIDVFKSIFGGRVSRSSTLKAKTIALDCVDLHIAEGERIGIIGRNGAGKSTLLQIIAGLAEPSDGQVSVCGRVSCVMSLGSCVRDECSGRENIYINGESNGYSHAEMDRVIDDIICFAELGEFIDHPVRTYSSGMKARLGFAMITFSKPEILLIDEALSVGDTGFCRKATSKMKELCARGRIVIIVSHSMQAIRDMCGRCVWMDKGRLRMAGEPDAVINAYIEAVRQEDDELFTKEMGARYAKFRKGELAEFKELDFFAEDLGRHMVFETRTEGFGVRLSFAALSKIERICAIRLRIFRSDGIIYVDDSFEIGCLEKGTHSYEMLLGRMDWGKGVYTAEARVLGGGEELLAGASVSFKIECSAYRHTNPAVWADCEWKFEELGA